MTVNLEAAKYIFFFNFKVSTLHLGKGVEEFNKIR